MSHNTICLSQRGANAGPQRAREQRQGQALPFVLITSRELEKEMATHSCILVWRNPWTEEAGRLQSMGLQRVGHD